MTGSIVVHYTVSVKVIDVSGKVTHVSGKVTHVSVYVRLLEGAYDAGLSWPLMGTVTFTLLNQLADNSMTLEYETKCNDKVGSTYYSILNSLIV